jgi:Tol biopolymer transport system component
VAAGPPPLPTAAETGPPEPPPAFREAEPDDGGSGGRRRGRSGALIAGLVALAVIAAGTVFALTRGGDDPKVTGNDTPGVTTGNDATTGAATAFTCAEVPTQDVGEDTGGTQLFAMDADGGNQARLTSGGAGRTGASFSPDCSQVAFSQTVDGNKDVYVLDLATGEERRVTTDPADDGSPEWSPNGTRLAFVSRRAGNLDIFTVNPDGSEEQQLTSDTSFDVFPAWSADGQHIVWTSGQLGKSQLFVMDEDGSNVRRVTSDEDQAPRDPAFAPDGTTIVYSALAGDGTRQLFDLSEERGREQITGEGGLSPGAGGLVAAAFQVALAGDNEQPQVSPDGATLIFTSNRDGNQELYSLDVESGAQHRLTNDPGADTGAEYSRDGSKIIWNRASVER